LFGGLHRSGPWQQYDLVGHDHARPDAELMQGAFEMRKLLTSLFLFLSVATVPVAGVATTVSPVVLDLQTNGRRVVSNISVTNTSAGPMTMEIAVTPLKPIPTGFEPAGPADSDEDMLVTPPSALIAAGKTQTFRVQWVGDPEMTRSKHYYVGVNQLPVKLPEGQSAVQIVYNFNVLVSVSSPDQKPQLAITAVAPATVDGKTVAAVTVHNGGTAHDYISQHRLKITETSASGVELASKAISGSEFQQLVGYGLVASGQTRTVDVPLDGPVPAGARLSAVFTNERAQ
jgi:P pilus assembly chaperone PapD